MSYPGALPARQYFTQVRTETTGGPMAVRYQLVIDCADLMKDPEGNEFDIN
jgi:hypothetical protein